MTGETFWTRLMDAMGEAGYARTQAAVARLIGIKQPSVHEWAYGGLPTVERCRELAGKLGVCVEWLYSGEGPRRPQVPTDKEAEKLWDIWRKLTTESRQNLTGYAAYLRSTQITASPERMREFHAALPALNEQHRRKARPKN